LLGSGAPMLRALTRLGGVHAAGSAGSLPQAMQAFGIAGGNQGWAAMFASHPPLEERIAALRANAP
jgi:heat shock protein HtpX